MIKFGTDGWRGIIADDFTVDNVKRVSWAIGKYILEEYGDRASVLVARDGRFLGEKFAAIAAGVLAAMGLKPTILEGPTATPTCAYAVKEYGARGAIMFTASHNPPEYQGLKYIPYFAGPATPDITGKIESYIAMAPSSVDTSDENIEYADPTESYIAHIKGIVQLEGNAQKIVVDTLHGVGGRYLPRILRECGFEAISINEDIRPDFAGLSPEPKKETLESLIGKVKELNVIGLSTDGDADRFGVVDEKGEFYPANYILAILYSYLLETGRTGGVARTVATTHMLDEIAKLTGQRVWETPVGFKYLGQLLLKEKVLLAGEESGGASIAGHIPEKDGILICLLVLKAVVETGRSLKELLEAVYDKIGAKYVSTRLDFKVAHEQKEKVISLINSWQDRSFCGDAVISVKRDDGLKIICERAWILLRPSGTEDVVRLYVEAKGEDILQKFKESAVNVFGLDVK